MYSFDNWMKLYVRIKITIYEQYLLSLKKYLVKIIIHYFYKYNLQ